MRVGDCIQGTRRQERNADVAGFERTPPSADVRALPAGDDREAFLNEVRKLSCNSECHVPVSLRDRFTIILTNLLDRISDGDVDACFLKEVRSKLLLSPIPKYRNKKVELSLRLKMWQERDFHQLLIRIQDQLRNQQSRPKKRPCLQSRGRRARYLVREGAKSRAVATLTSDVAALSTEEEIQYAEELLPSSVHAETALFIPVTPGIAREDLEDRDITQEARAYGIGDYEAYFYESTAIRGRYSWRL